MSYTIQYEGSIEEKLKEKVKKNRNIKRLLAPCCTAIVIILFLIQPVRAAVFDFLLPGDGTITFQAGENMIASIKEGQPIKDAFMDFCIEIVQNA